MAKFWNGSKPQCDLQPEHELKGIFYDARLPAGMWACMCHGCFESMECKTALGFGQKYRVQDDGRWLCVTE